MDGVNYILICKNAAFVVILSASFFLFDGCSSGTRRGKISGEGKREKIVSTANKYLGVKYKMGGTTPSGFDCSGYVMYVYHVNGLDLPRTASGQFLEGRKINIGTARPGDLVFFKTSSKRFSHVGIYLGNNRFIHSPRTGKKVSQAEMSNSYWKKRFVGAVTYF